jgi:hypothetical protein
MTTEELLRERGEVYGEAWLLTGEVVRYLGHDRLLKLVNSGHLYNWVTILCKLVRLLHSPNHLDSWEDVAGYARLSADHVKKSR